MAATVKASAPAPLPASASIAGGSSSTSRQHLLPPSKPIPSSLFTTTTTQPTKSSLPPPPPYTTARNSLKRRRSSFPPTQTHTSASTDVFDTSLWTSNSTSAKLGGRNKKDMAPYDGETNWETLLNLTPTSTPDNPFDGLFNNHAFKQGDASGSFSPSRIAQTASDLAWKTILGSTVHVESLGNVDVARLLREIWKRGGGDIVSNQCLWPSIIVALATEDMPHQRIPPPSAQASLALQSLYNMTLRKWEASVFSGLLGQFINSTSSHSNNQTARPSFSEAPIYGAATPTKDFDVSQWTNLTPGFDWTTLLNTTGGAEIGPFDPREDYVGGNRRGSIRNEDDQAKGIDELLAEMEEGREANERKASLTKGVTIVTPGQTTYTPGQTPASSTSTIDKGKSRQTHTQTQGESYLPTPETDDSPTNSYNSSQNPLTPDQAASPYVTGGSIATTSASISSGVSAVSRALSTGSGSRAPHPTTLNIPVNDFRPPPPMCMFFNPSFKDLTQGKIGAWRGDLNVRGGGKFSILVIAESGTEDIWQTSTWENEITYPPPTQSHQGGLTANMTPVAHLAQNGYVPTAMAMVLCNDPNVENFCSMVQKLHQEGVAFSLPNSRGMPLMFLPAKFDSSDNLQRLGLAYMTKAGEPAPGAGAGTKLAREASATPTVAAAETEKKRKRRQSAPAQAAGIKGAASRATAGSGSPAGGAGAGGGGRAKKRISLGLPKVDEAAEA